MAGTLDKMRSLLRDLIEEKSTQAEVGSWLGIDQSQVSRILNGKAPLESEKLLVILDGLGVPHRHFFTAVVGGEAIEPGCLLQLFRENAGLPADPFLSEIEFFCGDLSLHDRPASAGPSPRRQRLLELEGERFDDPAGVKQEPRAAR